MLFRFIYYFLLQKVVQLEKERIEAARKDIVDNSNKRLTGNTKAKAKSLQLTKGICSFHYLLGLS